MKNTIESDMLSRLSDQESSSNQMVVKLQEENRQFSADIERLSSYV